jgi:hypothetical protein
MKKQKQTRRIRLAFWLPEEEGTWVHSERARAGQTLSEFMRRLVEAAKKARTP